MADIKADSPFVRRLAAAARAGWWTLLIGAIILTVQFFGYTLVMRCEAFWSWELGLMNTDATTMNRMVLHYVAAMKGFLLLLLMASIFLSLWARRLRRVGDA
jgi:hypothetical protein